MLWPVLGSVVRLVIIAVGGAFIASSADAAAEEYFCVIGIALMVYAIITVTAIRLGVWTHGQAAGGANESS